MTNAEHEALVAAFDDLRQLRIKWAMQSHFRKRQATQEITAALMRAHYEGLIE